MSLPTPAGEYVNPFRIPGAGGRPDIPLSPWSNPQHADHYVDVDDTGRAFTKFCAEFSDPMIVRDVGWFVVTSGPDGCGKTSVINRCAHWLTGILKQAKITANIYDLTSEGNIGQVTNKRVEHVCSRLVSKVGIEIEDPRAATKFTDYRKDLNSALPFLSDALPADHAIILLLPSMDLFEEIQRYWAVTRKKIIVFAESKTPQAALTCDEQLSESTETRIVHLKVGPLQTGNGRMFTKARLDGQAAGTSFPDLDLDAPDRMIGGRIEGVGSTSIRLVQRTLCGLYEEYRLRPWPNGGMVRYKELTDYIARWSGAVDEWQR